MSITRYFPRRSGCSCSFQFCSTAAHKCFKLLVFIVLNSSLICLTMRQCGAKQRSFHPNDPMASNGTAGAAFATDPLTSAFLSWQNAILISSKTFLHWCFGQTFRLAYFPEDMKVFVDPLVYVTNYKTWTYSGDIQISFRSGPMITYGVSAMLVAVFVSFLAWRNPKGPQPSSWGHLQTLADMIDSWDVDDNGRFW
jgi:hypothetical protein